MQTEEIKLLAEQVKVAEQKRNEASRLLEASREECENAKWELIKAMVAYEKEELGLSGVDLESCLQAAVTAVPNMCRYNSGRLSFEGLRFIRQLQAVASRTHYRINWDKSTIALLLINNPTPEEFKKDLSLAQREMYTVLRSKLMELLPATKEIANKSLK